MDIRTAINELMEAGYSESQIAREVSVTAHQPTIHRIKTGKTRNPGYELGNAIIELHRKVLGDAEAA